MLGPLSGHDVADRWPIHGSGVSVFGQVVRMPGHQEHLSSLTEGNGDIIADPLPTSSLNGTGTSVPRARWRLEPGGTRIESRYAGLESCDADQCGSWAKPEQ
jgi:hypothetical protein